MFTETSLLSIGSNVGNREDYIQNAISQIEQIPEIKILQTSPIIETKAIIIEDQPDFLNMVILISTNLSPLQLLHTTQSIEKKIGRVFRYSKGPREIDIDILTYSQQVIQTQELTIPHPGLLDRKFLHQLLDSMNLKKEEFLLLFSKI
jgi:2-amino-4-hydroxy-6-hydroxymethyldihydropteridine diphosphokinase